MAGDATREKAFEKRGGYTSGQPLTKLPKAPTNAGSGSTSPSSAPEQQPPKP